MQQPANTVLPTWSQIEDGVTWATAGTPGRGLIRLMAEGLSDGSWEWTTWRAIRPDEFRSGSVLTREAACAAAERAASAMTAISHLPPLRSKPNAGRLSAP